MSITHDELREIAASIWITQLDLEPEETAVATLASALAGGMTGTVQIAGSWNGAVQLRCGRRLVERVAALMFALPPDRLTAADLRDALGELANMTAGNVKACLGHEACISLPTVVEGSDYGVSVPGSEVLEEVAFLLAGELLLVTVLVESAEA
jgi:chemotaxis protein CheX